ncbi:MAG: carboxypeptidase-like regulatory domain-containing protein, partial [Planctomycetaceae bacterium]|nr:carboxypeptidase-like regulatory domain-containing protein [Planctomycetaceae bacterium]
AGAAVTLIPDREGGTAEDAEQRNALATTDANGHFVMTTLDPNDGVYPGKYRVQVTKYEQSGKLVGTGEIDDMGKEIMFEPSVNRLPALYENYQKSQLSIDVPAGGIKNVKLDLVTKP